MENVILIAVLALILGGVVLYLYKTKKRGQKCVGCPYSGSCSGNCGNPKEEFDKTE